LRATGCAFFLFKAHLLSFVFWPPGAVAAATAAAKAPAAVVLLGKDEVAFGRVIKVAGLQG